MDCFYKQTTNIFDFSHHSLFRVHWLVIWGGKLYSLWKWKKIPKLTCTIKLSSHSHDLPSKCWIHKNVQIAQEESTAILFYWFPVFSGTHTDYGTLNSQRNPWKRTLISNQRHSVVSLIRGVVSISTVWLFYVFTVKFSDFFVFSSHTIHDNGRWVNFMSRI